MSCLQKERKPILPVKNLDVIFRRRYLPNTQYYFANRKHAVKEEKQKSDCSRPFRVPRSEKLLSYIKYSDRKEKLSARHKLSLPVRFKDNLKIAASRDISKRLFISEPPDDVRAVVEIHPEFYKVIEGRPTRSLDDIKVYINNIRAYAMSRQQIGYRRDLVMKIEENAMEEAVQYERVLEKIKEHIKNFEKFLTEDYKNACNKVSRAERVYMDLLSKNTEFLGYVSSVTILSNILFKLDAIRSTLKIYRSFLIFVAPLSWRQQHDENLKGKIQSIQFESGTFVTDNDLVDTLDIDKMMEFAKSELKNPPKTKLYFKKPKELKYLFRTMEIQSREYLIQLSKTDAPYRLLQERVKQLKQATKQELDYFQYYIDSINKEIDREIYNETYLQDKFFRILNETFFENVASPTTLKLKICVEYVYEEIFGKCEEGHQSLHDPMKILEVTYEDYNLRLDALDFKIVNAARSDFFSQDLKIMKNAYIAQRELKSFWEMKNAMNKAFLAPHHYARPILTKFLDKKTRMALLIAEKRKKQLETGEFGKNKKYKLTPEVKEGLLFFTDWCEGLNPEQYLIDYYTFVKPALDWEPHTSSIS